jgi:replicative DNA helicase
VGWRALFRESGGCDGVTDAFYIWEGNSAIKAVVDLAHYGQNRRDSVSYEIELEARQNAELIAAAPEMREILERVLKACNSADQAKLMHTLYREVQQRGAEVLEKIKKVA